MQGIASCEKGPCLIFHSGAGFRAVVQGNAECSSSLVTLDDEQQSKLATKVLKIMAGIVWQMIALIYAFTMLSGSL